jgi:hypothetical protein
MPYAYSELWLNLNYRDALGVRYLYDVACMSLSKLGDANRGLELTSLGYTPIPGIAFG